MSRDPMQSLLDSILPRPGIPSPLRPSPAEEAVRELCAMGWPTDAAQAKVESVVALAAESLSPMHELLDEVLRQATIMGYEECHRADAEGWSSREWQLRQRPVDLAELRAALEPDEGAERPS